MRWFRRLTGSIYEGKPIAEALGGIAAAIEESEAAAEGSWLARAYRATSGFLKRHYKAALGAAAGVGAMAAAERAAVADMIVDLNWRLVGDNSNISYIADKDELDPEVTGSYRWENPYGSVLFPNSSGVPKDWKLILLDNGGQPVGIQVITTKGAYNTFLYGDIPSTTTIDEGAPKSTPINVIAQSPDNKFFAANFDPSYTFIDLRNVVNRNVIVSNTEIPEPTTLALLGAGAGIAALMRRRRKRKDKESDIGKPQEPYYRRFE